MAGYRHGLAPGIGPQVGRRGQVWSMIAAFIRSPHHRRFYPVASLRPVGPHLFEHSEGFDRFGAHGLRVKPRHAPVNSRAHHGKAAAKPRGDVKLTLAADKRGDNRRRGHSSDRRCRLMVEDNDNHAARGRGIMASDRAMANVPKCVEVQSVEVVEIRTDQLTAI
jgi:hypothetical protein